MPTPLTQPRWQEVADAMYVELPRHPEAAIAIYKVAKEQQRMADAEWARALDRLARGLGLPTRSNNGNG